MGKIVLAIVFKRTYEMNWFLEHSDLQPCLLVPGVSPSISEQK